MSCNHRVGDLLAEVKRGVIMHQVNAQGRMGSGFARAAYERWPAVRAAYEENVLPGLPDRGLCYLGTVHYVEVEPGLWVANVVGQQFYGRDPARVYTSYEALEMGLHSVKNFAANNDLEVHYPLIGCGLANGDWTVVSSLIDKHFGDTIEHTLWELPT